MLTRQSNIHGRCPRVSFYVNLLKPTGITRVHGHPQEVTLGARNVLLYPIYHPAAALYTPSMLAVLEQDFARIPELLDRVLDPPAPRPEPPREAVLEAEPDSVQLGLF